MVILIVLGFLWMPYLLAELRSASRRRRARTTFPPGGHAPREATWAQTALLGHDGATWSALDDCQLTRLLTDSAPRSITE